MKEYYPVLTGDFNNWLIKYVDLSIVPDTASKSAEKCKNEKIYGCLENEKQYIQAIIDYISGMTDGYAIKAYNELISF